jgi:hypothetical protein
MAIQEPTQPAAAFAQPGSSAPAAAPAPAFQQPSDRISMFSMGNVGGIVRSATSEALAKGYEAVQNAIKDSRISQVYKVLGVQIDNQSETKLKLSSIVLVLQHLSSGTVSHHTLLLEASSDPLPPKMDNINGVQVQVDRYASQVYDQVYAATVDNTITAAFPSARAINTGATVVPRIFNWEDKDATRELVQNAMLAAATYIEARQDGFIDMDMSKMGTGEQLQVQISFENPQTLDFTGLPVRSDIQILTSAVTAQKVDTGSLNSQNDAIKVSCVTGFMDLVYTPPQDPNLMYAAGNMIGAKRRFRPRFIMTRLENSLRLTPAAQLFAIASAMCLGEGTTYYRAFKPRLNAGPRDRRDIGAVNIEANLQDDPSGVGAMIDTKTKTFGDRELGALVNATMHPGLIYSIDISDAGADTWYNRVFGQAAMGDMNANNEILRAANVLTGGQFAKLYGNNTFTAMIPREERVLMGYYINMDGQRADVRDVDYLAVLNILAVNNPQAIVDWSDTFERDDQAMALRLQGRKTTIRAVADQVVFTQQGIRATFNPDFLKLLGESLRSINVMFKLVNAGVAGDYVSQRAGGAFNQASFGVTSTGLFNQGFSGAAATSVARPFQPGSMF